jgi:DNA-binding response OmpR family regulator
MSQNQNRILLIEDEEALLFGFKKLLQNENTVVDTAQTLPEAKELLRQNIYRVVITDLRLTNAQIKEGYDVVALARGMQKNAKIIVITAYSENSTREQAMSLGADYFLEKPVAPKQIKEILDALKM